MGVHKIVRKAVFLDRDGVINRTFVRDGKPFPPCTIGDLEILPGVLEALEMLREAGFRLIVVTNQPDVASGTQTQEVVEAMHDVLKTRLPLDEFRVCYHDDAIRCECRKPAPGMLINAARDAGIDLGSSFMVGDRWRDVEAGRRAGCVTVFVDYGYAETQPRGADKHVHSLREAAEWILALDRNP